MVVVCVCVCVCVCARACVINCTDTKGNAQDNMFVDYCDYSNGKM